jgi:hypothetical protein
VDDPDPFELHAKRFLARLQRLSVEVRTTGESIDGILLELNKCWPQILAAFRWTTSERNAKSIAAEIADALLACAGGDAQFEFRRSAEDVRRWANAASDYAKRLCVEPNDAAFLYRFAGIALVESGIVQIAQETRQQVSEILGIVNAVMDHLNNRESPNHAPSKPPTQTN